MLPISILWNSTESSEKLQSVTKCYKTLWNVMKCYNFPFNDIKGWNCEILIQNCAVRDQLKTCDISRFANKVSFPNNEFYFLFLVWTKIKQTAANWHTRIKYSNIMPAQRGATSCAVIYIFSQPSILWGGSCLYLTKTLPTSMFRQFSHTTSCYCNR